MAVRDNGVGIREEALSGSASLGILGMRERALLLGGELLVTGAPNRGTRVRVRIPFAASHNEAIAHDFNNLLTTILGRASLMYAELPVGP